MKITISKTDKHPVSVHEFGSDHPTPGIDSKAILHELLHLKYPNHGKMFKALFKAYLRRG